MTMPVLDEELILNELTEVRPPCEAGEDDVPDCGNPAEWILVWSCPCVAFYCAEHKEQFAEAFAAGDEYARSRGGHMVFGCTEHHCETTIVRWERL